MAQTRSVKVGPITIGNNEITVIGGPCAIESHSQFLTAAESVQKSGAQILRGGLYKLRTNPESFQGLGESAFSWVQEAKTKFNMPFISEITDPRQIELFEGLVDIFQVGSRNMYNYALLKELGQTRKPVLLKRGFSATYEEWIKAAEYIEKGGNDRVILCERGIRTFETATRNTLDLNGVAYIKAHTHFPIIVDPSHGTGRPELIEPMALAGIAAGADGLMIEAHPHPKEALSDAHQALSLDKFRDILNKIRLLAPVLGKSFHGSTDSKLQASASTLDTLRPKDSGHKEGTLGDRI